MLNWSLIDVLELSGLFLTKFVNTVPDLTVKLNPKKSSKSKCIEIPTAGTTRKLHRLISFVSNGVNREVKEAVTQLSVYTAFEVKDAVTQLSVWCRPFSTP